MRVSLKKKNMYRFAKLVHTVCVTGSSFLLTLLCKCTCDTVQGRANHVQVSITSSTHLCTVRADCSGYLSVWEAEAQILVSVPVRSSLCRCGCEYLQVRVSAHCTHTPVLWI